ncbi:UNVERIFIED_CONTAM: branched-chain amino acid transport system ATP-binding protein [Brevibacillus sp. OAP136]
MLRVESISKSFGGFQALKDVSFNIDDGEVLGIMGPNGAGKTTLFNMIMQELSADTGTITFQNQVINRLGSDKITLAGIGRTYQIPQPFRNMTVLENVMVGQMFSSKDKSVSTARDHAREILKKVGLLRRADTMASQLGLLELKRLELAKALSTKPKLLLLDEIAGGLVDSEVLELKEILMELKQSGQTMLMIEHILTLLFEMSDRIAVMKFGQKIAEGKPQEVINNPEVIEAYLGTTERKDEPVFKSAEGSPAHLPAPTLLHVEGLNASYGEFKALSDVSLEVREKEIVGIIGLNGAGKTTLIRSLTKLIPNVYGKIEFKGIDVSKVKAHEIVSLGIAQSIEGRKIFPELTVLENLELGLYSPRTRAKKKELLEKIFTLFPILYERRNQIGTTMSGGQQQQLAIGRALMAEPDLLICDEISLGLAPLVIEQLYESINEINRQGTAVLLVEQSIERALRTVDRAYIIESGRIVMSGTAEALYHNPDFQTSYFGVTV